MSDDRKPVYARVSAGAHEGWVMTPRIYQATMTSLAEVIGRELASLDAPLSKLPRHWRAWFTEAAQLEREHRANQGRRG